MPDHNYEKYPELTNKQIAEFGLQSPHKQITEDNNEGRGLLNAIY